MRTRLLVMGGGRMGSALVSGLLSAGWVGIDGIVVVEKDAGARKRLCAARPGLRVIAEVAGAQGPVEGAVLAIKPADAAGACRALGAVAPPRVLSIAAGVRTGDLEGWLGSGVAVVRAMPNTPALVGAAATAIAPGSGAGAADLDWAEGILGSVGIVARTEEALLDAVTGLSGSGPAYFFFLAESLVAAGTSVGLEPGMSRTLTVQTLLGSARMLAETGASPEELRAMVTSPGGTTAAGIEVLEGAGVRAALVAAVQAATRRSGELGGA